MQPSHRLLSRATSTRILWSILLPPPTRPLRPFSSTKFLRDESKPPGKVEAFEKTPRNKVRRYPLRGHYEKEEVYKILDDGFYCHVGLIPEGDEYPTVIPMVYGRKGDSLYLHGHAASRLLRRINAGVPVCVTVTHVDGLVYARSLFHSSLNYRSVVLYGRGQLIDDPIEQEDALKVIVDHLMPGRWDEARDPSMQELILTSVIKVDIESASAKIREGPPGDDKADIRVSQIWAGVLPLKLTAQDPISAPDLIEPKPPVPDYVINNRFNSPIIKDKGDD